MHSGSDSSDTPRGLAALAPLARAAQQVGPIARLGARRVLGRKSPFQMTLSLTNHCNFLCDYCTIPLKRQAEMSPDQWCALIDEFRAGGMGRVSLMGGEPLVKKGVGQIIHHLNRVGVHSAMNTNGWLVSERMDDVTKLDLVCISLDGPEAVHDTQRRREGSYRRIIDAIEQLRRRNRPVVTMTVMTASSIGTVRHVLEVAKAMGTRAYFQLVHDAVGDVDLPVADSVTRAQVEATMDELLHLKAEGWPVGNSAALLQQQRANRLIGSCAECHAGSYYGYVFCDGTVAPCVLTQKQVERGNGHARGFLRAFQELEAPQGPGCSCAPTHEVNRILNFDFGALFEALDAALRPAALRPVADH
ncbi:MAG: radical SAM protein [Candidatus Binatia bacterium]